MKSTNTSAHTWLRKVIQENDNANKLSGITRIPVNNFYYWLTKEIEEGEDLLDKNWHADALQNVSKFKSLAVKLKPSLKKFK